MECTQVSILHPCTSVSASYQVISKMYLVVLVVVLSSTGQCDPPPNRPMPDNIANACDTDQVEVTTNPVDIDASTNEIYDSQESYDKVYSSSGLQDKRMTYCSLLVNAPNSTAISVSVLDSGIINVGTYFYIEVLESQILTNSKRIKLISLESTPCVVILQGNQFRFHFQSYADLKVRICNKDTEKPACYETIHPKIATQCRITPHENKIQTKQSRFSYGLLWGNYTSVMMTQFQAKCTCGCPDTCICTLGYRQWLSACINTNKDNTTTADLVVYKPTMRGLSFDNTGMHAIQHNALLGLKMVLVLVLSNNRLPMLQPTVCQNLPRLEVLKVDKNKLVNLTSNAFTGPCGQQLKILDLQSNELTYLPHDLFQSTVKLRYLNLTQNRLVHIPSDLFSSVSVLLELWLGDNAISSLLADVLDSLGELKTLDLHGNSISTLPGGVFNSLGELWILYLSGNNISTLPDGIFDSLEKLTFLHLSGNTISTLPVGVFDSLGELKTLVLSGNNISILPMGVFGSLGELKNLVLSGNNISTLPVGVFGSLGELKTLVLSGNNISILPVGVFGSLGELKTLVLSDNNISILKVGVFGSLGELKTLVLSGNNISILPVGVFGSLGELKTLVLSDNNISILKVGVFGSLGELKTLVLSDNNISILPVGVFGSLGELKTLVLSGNNISTLPVGVFGSLGELKSLDLSGSNINILQVGAFDSLGELIFLHLSGNNISILPMGVFGSLGELKTLDLSGNNISILPLGVFDILGELIFLYLNGNDIPTLRDGLFDSLGELKTLDLSGNNISILPVGVFGSLGNLTILYLRSDNISTLPDGVFKSLKELKTLDLSNNRIELLPRKVFNSQQDLLILDISDNALFSLSDGIFLMLHNLISLNLCCNNLKTIASQTFQSLTKLKILDISKNSIEKFPPHLFESPSNLLSLKISENNLRTIHITLFRNLSSLIYLNMSRNSLLRLPSFNAQGQLQVLDVSENQLTILKQVALQNLKNLILFSMAKNLITALDSKVLFPLDSIEFINASYNAIQKIGSEVVSGETKLKTFDLRGNEMYEVTPHSFTSLTNSTIIVDKYATCCFLNEGKCVSMKPRTEYLTCSRMLQDVVLRISVWILGLSAFIFNIIAYCVRSRKQQAKIKVQTLLISHLALSDLLMGVNMIILAIADVYYGQYFPSYAHTWIQGFACKLAGFLSIFSSEGSVFFITLISIDRMLRIKYPFGGRRLEIKFARILVTLAWLMALLISVIPISLTSHEGNFYSISEVCIGIPIVRKHLTTLVKKSTEIKTITISRSHEWRANNIWHNLWHMYVRDISVNINLESVKNITYTIAENAGSQIGSIYSIVIFISVNLFCFVIVAFCYLYIFIKARRTTERASGSQNHNDELRMAKKMFAIVFTDFCCWVPLSFVCILTQSGVIEVSPEMYAWTVGFILPINSSINPFLYVLYDTISDRSKKKQEDRKAREEIEMQVRWKPLKSFGLRFEENE